MKSLSPLLAAAALLLAGCDDPPPFNPGEVPFEPDRPTLAEVKRAPAYTGTDAFVLEAQATYPTGLDLHRKLVLRTCGGTNGVCHNQKEYPDMHTAASFAATIGAPCNVQPGSWSTVFDRCERRGDTLKFGADAAPLQLGWLDFVPGEEQQFGEGRPGPDEATPGLHVMLADPVPGDWTNRWVDVAFVRGFVNNVGEVQTLPYAHFATTWWVVGGDRRRLYGEVREYQRDEAALLLRSGVVQGDHNRNGRYGGSTLESVTMLNPGLPERSYLVARLRGHMEGAVVPGSRMPLANQPPSVPDMLALMCFIEGLRGFQPGTQLWNLASDIDFESCSYKANPASLNLVGQGVTWSGRIKPLLDAQCVGCHSGAQASGGLDLGGDTYARLLEAAIGKPALKLVQPGQPEKSYLWLKVSGDGSVLGQRMPLDEAGRPVPMAADQLRDLETWIIAGALKD